jgi:membrane dipeptidase
MMEKMKNSEEVHRSALVIDSHADTPQRFVDEGFDLADPLGAGDFNLDSARAGNLGAEFFAIWAEPERYKGQYARRTLELIDAVRRQVARHADQMVLATSAEEIEKARSEGKFAALMGIEGGHSIEDSLALLRIYYELGARYMTLTWNNSNGWADSSGDIEDARVPHTANGLTEFGVEVIREMNRLGMMVDVSHVSDATFFRVLAVSRAPVIASHSCARALCKVGRNLTDEMLIAVTRSGGARSNGGVVQVNFYNGFLSQEYRDAQKALEPESKGQIEALKKQTAKVRREPTYGEVEQIHRKLAGRIQRPSLSLLIDHIDHVARVAGIDHVGIGSDFDGVAGRLPEGIDSPADLPKITAALMERGYSAEDCRKILGGNLLRVFREVEKTGNEGTRE